MWTGWNKTRRNTEMSILVQEEPNEGSSNGHNEEDVKFN